MLSSAISIVSNTSSYVSLSNEINLLRISGNLHGAETRESGAVSYRKVLPIVYTHVTSTVLLQERKAVR